MKWKFAWLSSILVSALFAIFKATYFSGGRLYFEQVVWQDVDKMPYKEAQQYLLERSQEVTRWESLKNAVQYSEYWQVFLADFFGFMFMCLSCFFIYAKLAIKKENSTV